MRCLWCQQDKDQILTIQEILRPQPLLFHRICKVCIQNFEVIPPGLGCPWCRKVQLNSEICMDCQFWRRLYPKETLQHEALFYYNSTMKDYFQQFKGNGDYQLRNLFQKQIAVALHKKGYDLYCFIPSDTQHFNQRGFDQIRALFGDHVENTTLLQKMPTQVAQAQKNRQQRFESEQFFVFSGQYKKLHHAEKILLLDDIYTTGRTFFHGRQCLRSAGFRGRIDTFSLVRA